MRRYAVIGLDGGFVVAEPHGRESLADVIVHKGRFCLADARAGIAEDFARLPGLTVAAARLDGDRLVVGDRRGGIAVIRATPEAGAIGAYAWLRSGRVLARLGSVRPVEARPDPIRPRAGDLRVELQRLRQIAAGGHRIVVVLGHVGETDQDVRFIGLRP